MKISQDTEAALDLLASSQGELRKRNDLATILETAATNSLIAEIHELTLSGKNTWSCYGILRRMSANDEGYQRLEQEFMTNLNSLRSGLLRFSEMLPAIEQERFTTIYLGMTRGTIRNLVDLAHDLSALKNVQNSSKYGDAAGE
ncbi:MAG TPA: hypothetical protein PLI74_02200 [Candidatus Kapabacteria bacterium]|nr:hypothetical protein [Ignavibacteria bacterium]HRI30102.1 hypothetical protein [Candidatus Kapabacteria bacterium]HRK58428.1 hypothetical protein [Candidatus Kapabacteria bacterium]